MVNCLKLLPELELLVLHLGLYMLLYGLPNNQLAKIQGVLNASARLVCNAPRFCHITPIMRD